MLWWRNASPDSRYEAIVCDGAVRSGKTLCMALGFFLWAMCSFENQRFGLCGKTITSLERNVLQEVLPRLGSFGMEQKKQGHQLTVRFAGRRNDFYVFGGKDESSAALIQGITFAGVLLDEVALMPRSFVQQACARCSVSGSRLWFNCNPEGPQHWFYREWIVGAKAKNCLHLHFTMDDNPSLSPEIRARYMRLYSGTFYRRFVLGQWVAAEGRVYDFFDPGSAPEPPQGRFSRWVISCDYGTVNPASFGLWGLLDGVWYRVKEFYFDSRREQRQMTDEEYADALEKLSDGKKIASVIVDPSAASFHETLRRRGFAVKSADNDVLSGIRRTADALRSGKIVICASCVDCLRETELYVWQDDRSRDAVKKQNDHAMDDMRYFVTSEVSQTAHFAAKAVQRF